ncbi:hypothetical protein [Nocardioides taihuensis]|uniref:Secreted protein n=1 Tax=Nocardioides taihuensis TaxID=1835606 RepID=A0ABW0BK38_9ACTN
MRLLSTLVRVALVGVLGVFLSAGVASADPPGNNGTVKIDGVAFDQYPDNEPHVGCTFQVDFYGFDLGDLNASVKFSAQPPTGKSITLLTDTVFIGEDAAGGGTDVDAQRTYDLSGALKLFMAHPNQGYHVKLKVNAPGSIGKDTKYKTFWVTGCAGY